MKKGAKVRSGALFGTDFYSVTQKPRNPTRLAGKKSKVRHGYIDADAALLAIERKMGLRPQARSTVEPVTRARVVQTSYKPPPHADKIPAQHPGQKPRYQGYATPFTPGQLAHMVGAPGKVAREPSFTPKSKNIVPPRSVVSVRTDRVMEFIKNIRRSQDRQVVEIGGTEDWGIGHFTKVFIGGAEAEKQPKVTILEHYFWEFQCWEFEEYSMEDHISICGEPGNGPPNGACKVERCKVCERLLEGGPQAIEAHQALLREV